MDSFLLKKTGQQRLLSGTIITAVPPVLSRHWSDGISRNDNGR